MIDYKLFILLKKKKKKNLFYSYISHYYLND